MYDAYMKFRVQIIYKKFRVEFMMHAWNFGSNFWCTSYTKFRVKIGVRYDLHTWNFESEVYVYKSYTEHIMHLIYIVYDAHTLPYTRTQTCRIYPKTVRVKKSCIQVMYSAYRVAKMHAPFLTNAHTPAECILRLFGRLPMIFPRCPPRPPATFVHSPHLRWQERSEPV